MPLIPDELRDMIDANIEVLLFDYAREKPSEYSGFARVQQTKRPFITKGFVKSFPVPGEVGVLEPYPEVEIQELGHKTLRHRKFGFATRMPLETLEDDLSGITKDTSKAMFRAGRERLEIQAAVPLNAAFDATVVGVDGEALCSTAHPTDIGNVSNRLAAPVTFSPGAMLSCLQLADAVKDEAGKDVQIMLNKWIIHPNQRARAIESLQSPQAPYTANNTVNWATRWNTDFRVVPCRKLTDEYRWFGIESSETPFHIIFRIKPVVVRSEEWRDDSIGHKWRTRLTEGWWDWKYVVGVPGPTD